MASTYAKITKALRGCLDVSRNIPLRASHQNNFPNLLFEGQVQACIEADTQFHYPIFLQMYFILLSNQLRKGDCIFI